MFNNSLAVGDTVLLKKAGETKGEIARVVALDQTHLYVDVNPLHPFVRCFHHEVKKIF